MATIVAVGSTARGGNGQYRMPPLGAAAAGVAAGLTTAATTDFVRQRVRPVEYEIHKGREKIKRERREDQADEVLSAAEINKKAAVNQMNQMLEKANQAQSVGLIRAGMGKGVPVGVISHLLVQVKGELEEAVRAAREAGVSEEAIRPALEGLEAIKATQSDES